MKYGFIKVASAVPVVHVADCIQNTKEIEFLIDKAERQGVEIIVFPELCITGYTCQDLFRQQLLLDAAEICLMHIMEFSKKFDIISIVGLPVVAEDLLLNCAAIVQHGKLLGLVSKTYLPNYNVGLPPVRIYVNELSILPVIRFCLQLRPNYSGHTMGPSLV